MLCSDESIKKRKKKSSIADFLVSFHYPISGYFSSLGFHLLCIPFSSIHIKNLDRDGRSIPGEAGGEHLCLPERWHGAALFEFRCDVYTESSVSAERMHLAPHIKSLPHSRSRFHILFHITGTDKGGSVQRPVVWSGSPRNTSLLVKHCGDRRGWSSKQSSLATSRPRVNAATLRWPEFLKWTVSFSFATPTSLKRGLPGERAFADMGGHK